MCSYDKYLGLVVGYAESLGFAVYFDYKGISHINWHRGELNKPNDIYIEGGYDEEEIIYLLLHELGHHELRKDWGEYERILPISANGEKKHMHEGEIKYKRRRDYKVSSMEEEFMAWDAGYRLGLELGVEINRERWDKLRVGFLWAYMCHFVGKKKK